MATKSAVYAQLHQLAMLMHRAALSQGGMHNPHRGQGRVLAILKIKPVISQRELTCLLHMSRQAVAELIAKLEKSGYITREPSPEDRRGLTIRLTEAGARAADAPPAAPWADDALGCLNDAELAALSEYLERIIAGYGDRFPAMTWPHRNR